jgi:uncharacterized protein (TIRG00374 family)
MRQSAGSPRPEPGQGRHLPRIPRWVRNSASLALLGLVIWLLVVPQFAEARQAVHALESISFPLVLLAIGLELSSLLAFSALTAVVLGPTRPSYFTLLRIDLTNLGMNHVIPGGGAAATAWRFRLLGQAGVPASAAFMTAAIEALGTNVLLGLIFIVGIALSIATVPATGNDIWALVIVLVLLLGVGAAIWALTRHAENTVRAARGLARRLRVVTEEQAEEFVRKIVQQLRELMKNPRRMSAALALGAANWLLDAAALWVVLAALGHAPGIGALLTVYGVAGILAQLPLTPGGLGIVEGVLVPSLILFGTPPATALVAVIGWRLLEYWLPIPLAMLSYLSLRLGVLRVDGAKRSPPPTSPSR